MTMIKDLGAIRAFSTHNRLFCPILFFISLFVLPLAHAQTHILIGGALHTCSSLSAKHCLDKTNLQGKRSNLYQLDEQAIDRLEKHWPEQYQQQKMRTINALKAITSEQKMSRQALLDQWHAVDEQVALIADELYYFILDNLEVYQGDKRQRLVERVDKTRTRSQAAKDIVAFIEKATLAAAQQQKQPAKILAITASSRDPYESADFYEQLLQFDGVETQWLALTPALAQAITENRCEALPALRAKALSFARSRIYPERIAQEHALCEAGVASLVEKIQSATAVMFNGGDQSLTRKILFADDGAPYPWTAALKARPVIVGTSAGTAVQSGGSNEHGAVAMITSGSSIGALSAGAKPHSAPSTRVQQRRGVTYEQKGGLGSFTYGVLDTHFSERNRSVRLHSLVQHIGQHHGYGVDETTALVTLSSASGSGAAVLGAAGVVKITPTAENAFRYSFYPAGVRLKLKDGHWQLAENTEQVSSPQLANQALPDIRFNDIMYDAKLRSLTQAMCMTNTKKALAQQFADGQYWHFTLNADEQTRMVNTAISNNACAVENLLISFSKAS
ncbi:cyanophycinase [Pseudoalteromonas sp. CO325X]|uniref:cyanophycinase n=1 Tax=Pseudoalteromonas sp. CO325X TaxID=1777262 RepID=UPI001022CDBA|nr:cyanophycinase [Pseudoalteromonas sp. CO325X]RZF81490.1 cyanophycinase [Pseudoalteromonas sp. CO325X]